MSIQPPTEDQTPGPPRYPAITVQIPAGNPNRSAILSSGAVYVRVDELVAYLRDAADQYTIPSNAEPPATLRLALRHQPETVLGATTQAGVQNGLRQAAEKLAGLIPGGAL